MTDLSAFPITRKWPAAHPERLQLYSLPTPNGVKVSIMLEEIGLAYEAHKVSFEHEEQLSPEFISLSANNKIPAIHFFAGKDFEDKRPRDRYVNESRRLLGVLDRHLHGRDWMVDDYSIADIAILPWVRNLVDRYNARELVQFEQFKDVQRVLDNFLARPAVQRGLTIPS